VKTFEVKILGQRYKIRSDEKEEYIQGLAKYVCEQIGEIQQSTKTAATHTLAILVALQFADELLKQKGNDERFRKEVRERVRHILRIIQSNRDGPAA
jgi:cell division protein ZapA (FtsZ GTPase activity inhibitor)